MRLNDFRVLTFDCYGTLIDWESGIHAALGPLLRRSGDGLSRDGILEAFAKHESSQQAETPAMPYPDVLAAVHDRLALEWGVAPSGGEARRFGASVPRWPPFPDSAASLRYLADHFRLVVLSNVDRTSFVGSSAALGVPFDAVYTAQDIGSYKPDPRNFSFMLAQLRETGTDPSEVLHVAQSLFHDHVPARAAGLASAWIDRRHSTVGWGATPPPASEPQPAFRFESMAALADAHRRTLGTRS